MDKQYGIAVIGAGARSRVVVKHLLEDANNQVKILALYDPKPEMIQRTIDYWKSETPQRCTTYMEAINTPGVEWVMVFSPNAFHKEHILAAFRAGKDVFSEKPLATSIADCQEINRVQQETGRVFATGFVLRYAPIYRKAKEFLESGKFGKLIAIEANENIRPAHGSYIMRNWRRLTKLAGPHILEKCCHDLDLINWFTDSLPSKVAAFGGRNFFIPANNFMMEKYDKKYFTWKDPYETPTPFSDDSDLQDNTIAIAQFRNQVRVTFCATMSNAIPERRMNFICTEGTFKLDLYEKKLHYKQFDADGITTLNFDGDGHGGGDSYIMKELFETMSQGVPPKCSGAEGLRSAVYALAIDKATQINQVIDLEPIWKSLGV